MGKILITRIYDEIIEYYKSHRIIDVYKAFSLDITIISNNEIIDTSDLDMDYYDFLSENELPYVDNYNEENLKRYLTNNFSYLMKNVLYVDMKQLEAEGQYGSFLIDENDAPIIKEILMRSISQNEKDLIIGKWLKGKVEDTSYSEIYQLSQRLVYVIKTIPTYDEIKEQWIQALRYALRSDMVNTIIEVEATIIDIFCNSLPFSVDQYSDIHNEFKSHSQLSDLLINFTNSIHEQVKSSTVQAVYKYLETTDLDSIIANNDLPPVELLKLKSISEYMYSHPQVTKGFPNSIIVAKIIKYFKSVDKDFIDKSERRKAKDKERYEQKKIKK